MEHNLITNIRLGCKRLPTTNCLAYLTESPVKKNKSLMNLTKIAHNLFFGVYVLTLFVSQTVSQQIKKSLLLCNGLALSRVSTPNGAFLTIFTCSLYNLGHFVIVDFFHFLETFQITKIYNKFTPKSLYRTGLRSRSH